MSANPLLWWLSQGIYQRLLWGFFSHRLDCCWNLKTYGNESRVRMSLCGIADKHAMKLRSSSLQGKSTSVQSEQGKSKYGIISDISARTVVISKSESETNSSTSNVQSTPSLFRPESAKRYNLRSRPEVLSTPLPKYRAASSKLNVQKRITRQKGVRASPTNGPRTCPICVESKTR